MTINETDTLEALNAEYLRCYQDGDKSGFDGILSEDFYETDATGELLNRDAFLTKIAPLKGHFPFMLSADDIFIRILGDTAIIHAVSKLTLKDGSPQQGGGRYTDIWQRQGDQWKAIAAQVARVPAS